MSNFISNFVKSIASSFTFSNDVCIDLGTANTVVSIKGKGVVLNEPSVVAVKILNDGTYEVLAVGEAAKQMVGRTPINIRAFYPMKDGVIADYQIAEEMIKAFIKKANKNVLFTSRVLICVPYSATGVDKKAIHDSALAAGARKVVLIEEPLAAAVGADMPVNLPQGSMIIDIGGGTTEVGVISLGNIAFAKSYVIGGNTMDEAIKEYLNKMFNIKVGDTTAELIKKEIGCVFGGDVHEMIVRGFDLQKGGPKEITITSKHVKESLEGVLRNMGDAIKSMFENREVSYDLCGDIARDGVVLSGGGALLEGLDKYLSEYTGLNVRTAKDPLLCVIKGLEKISLEKDSW